MFAVKSPPNAFPTLEKAFPSPKKTFCAFKKGFPEVR